MSLYGFLESGVFIQIFAFQPYPAAIRLCYLDERHIIYYIIIRIYEPVKRTKRPDYYYS